MIGLVRHAGFGGRVAAFAALAAIFAAWLVAPAEYLRGQRLDDRKVNNGYLGLIANTASQFDPLVQQYIQLALEKDSKVTELLLHIDRRCADGRND